MVFLQLMWIDIIYTVQNSLCGKKNRGKSDGMTNEVDEVVPRKDENSRRGYALIGEKGCYLSD
jgi:hypothetical protein